MVKRFASNPQQRFSACVWGGEYISVCAYIGWDCIKSGSVLWNLGKGNVDCGQGMMVVIRAVAAWFS